MADTPQTTDGWCEQGEREEARRLAARIRSFEQEAKLLKGWMPGDLRDIARRLEDHANA